MFNYISLFLYILICNIFIFSNAFHCNNQIECLNNFQQDSVCSFNESDTTFNYTLINENTSHYIFRFVSNKNTCGHEGYTVQSNHLKHVNNSEECRDHNDAHNSDKFNFPDTRISLNQEDRKCSKMKFDFCLRYLFTGCYSFTIVPYLGSNTQKSITYHVWLNNNFRLDNYTFHPPVYKKIVGADPIEVVWEFRNGTFIDNDTSIEVELLNEDVSNVTQSCSLNKNHVYCKYSNLTHGEHMLQLTINDSMRCNSEDLYGACVWLGNLSNPAPLNDRAVIARSVKDLRVLDWILVGALIVIFALVLIAFVWFRKYKRRMNLNIPIEIYPSDSKKAVKGILLLYARDCTPFMDTMVELRSYLAIRTKSKIYDIFDSNIFDEIAMSPHEFIESLLQDPQINVVVISTECFEQLYQSMLQYYSHLSNKGKEVSHLTQLYRKPYWLDGLVIHALKLISYDTSPTSYKKFFVVRLPKFNGLGNYLIHINPCTRFDIPGGLDTLIEKVSSLPQENGMMESIEVRENLHRTLYNLNTFILNNPEYLYKEILKCKLEWNVE